MLTDAPMNYSFSDALEMLKQGKKMARGNWNGIGMYIELQIPDQNSKMKQPYIYIVPSSKWVVPWTASQVDLLSDDWYEVTA